MKRKMIEWFSLQRVKNPGRMVLGAIVIFNLLLLLLATFVISALSLRGTENMGFIEAAFYTVTMILDPGCISFVVDDIGHAGVLLSVFCLIVVIVGMISFTGSLIGYVTNYISHFIESSNAGKHKVRISNHVVILNWNTRASEILNDFLYSEKKQKIMVLVNSRKEEIQREIEERLSDTIARENKAIVKEYEHLPFFARHRAIRKNRFRNNLQVVVREGDIFSNKQLQDISLELAHSIIILGSDINNTLCKFEHKEKLEKSRKGNSQTIKTLMQVADITSAAGSVDNQRIVVEITDDWTWGLVQKIIAAKQVDGKCNIVPVRVNEVLGQILSQFSLMPELNSAYEELFSNRGAEFYTVEKQVDDLVAYTKEYLKTHRHSIPVSNMVVDGKHYCYYVAGCDEDLDIEMPSKCEPIQIKLNHEYWLEQKNVVILGHNTKSKDIMQGFVSFCGEWNREDQQGVQIVVIDDEENLKKMNYYKEYPFVIKTVAADIYDEELICTTVEEFVDQNENDTSILILSDDAVLNEDIDANALANLIYIQQIINKKKEENPDFDLGRIDVIVEIIDPKHHDIVNSYSVNNVVISNRYISKMIAQIGEVDALFDFYNDILTYDDEETDSKEIYIKKVERYFAEIPGKCTAEQLIRGIVDAATDPSLPKKYINLAAALGYVKKDGTMVIFSGDQANIEVELEKGDKIILLADH